MKLLSVIVTVLVPLVAVLAACTPAPANAGLATATPSPAQDSWNACAKFIQDKVGLPSAQAPAYSRASVTTSSSGEFTVAIFYAKTSAVYRCGLVRQADGSWQLESLNSLPSADVSIWTLRK